MLCTRRKLDRRVKGAHTYTRAQIPDIVMTAAPQLPVCHRAYPKCHSFVGINIKILSFIRKLQKFMDKPRIYVTTCTATQNILFTAQDVYNIFLCKNQKHSQNNDGIVCFLHFCGEKNALKNNFICRELNTCFGIFISLPYLMVLYFPLLSIISMTLSLLIKICLHW